MLRMEQCHKMPAERNDSCRKARSRWNSILRRPKSREQEKSHCGSATAKTDIGKCPLKLLCRDGDSMTRSMPPLLIKPPLEPIQVSRPFQILGIDIIDLPLTDSHAGLF